MKIEFVKITAQGNDYIYIDNRQDEYPLGEGEKREIAIKWSRRRFDIGSDGVVWLERSVDHDCRMEMYNADGSRGKMCGSALRSVVYLLGKEKPERDFLVETDSGLRLGRVFESGHVRVNMGEVSLEKEIGDQTYLVNVGNLHIVKIVEDIESIDLEAEKRMLRIDEGSGYNYEYAMIGENHLKIKIYEQGSGITFACGTGAAACGYLVIERGLVKGNEIVVEMPGGEVEIKKIGKEIYLTGKVKEVYWGWREI